MLTSLVSTVVTHLASAHRPTHPTHTVPAPCAVPALCFPLWPQRWHNIINTKTPTHLDTLQVVLREGVAGCWAGEEEGVVCVTRRVLLRLEEAVKVPEGALHVVVGGHLCEAHVGEDLAVLAAHLWACTGHTPNEDRLRAGSRVKEGMEGAGLGVFAARCHAPESLLLCLLLRLLLRSCGPPSHNTLTCLPIYLQPTPHPPSHNTSTDLFIYLQPNPHPPS